MTNSSALYASRTLADTALRHARSSARLTSGLRINSAQDDAAGLAIASRMQARGRGQAVELRNLNDQVSLLQMADSALGSISDNLQRIRELALQAANSGYAMTDRQAMQAEVDQLITNSRKIQTETSFNGIALLDGSLQAGSFYLAPLFLPKTTDTLLRYAQMAQASATLTPGGALAAGDLTINTKAVPVSQAGAGAGQSADSAWAIANALNQTGITGLSATANSNSFTGTATVLPNNGNVLAGQIVINGVAVPAGSVVNAINQIAGQTGVTVQAIAGTTVPGSPPQTPYTLVLTANDGRNIDISGASAFGLNDSHTVSSIAITGPLAEGSAANLTIAGNNPGNAGFSGSIAAVDVGDLVPVPLTESEGYELNPTVKDADSAQATIALMDRKLDKLLVLRTQIGARANALDFESRFLQSSRESLLASTSRIQDADYAAETTKLTRERILLEAGYAISAQANAQSQRVLQLLIGYR